VPRQQGVNVQNSFVQGLITEATGLNFPENACTETWDCRFDYKGIVSRRFGFDYESSFELDTVVRSNSAITEYVWRAPNGDGTTTLVVVQVGSTIHFYAEDVDGPLSPGYKAFSVDLTTLDVAGNPGVGTVPCQYATGKGLLFVTNAYCDPFYVTLSADGTSISTTAITIKQRDFDGLTPTATYPDFVTRPTSTRAALDDFDEYNLMNQGWSQTVELQGGTSANNLDQWDTDLTTMPSLADVWWLFKGTVGFDTGIVDKYGRPNSRAPQGYYILNSFLQERDVVSGIAGLSNDDVTSSYFRPVTCAFYAGRAFYAGVTYSGYNTKIYFSQIIENNAQVGYCYQANDPTSEENSDLLPSDGGVIVIPDVENIVKLFAMGPIMLVFATNGVWAISGSSTDGLGFAANDYTIRKISSVGAVSGYSFVDVEGIPMFWNRYGIWSVKSDDIGNLEVVSLTEKTIQSFFDEIPADNKGYAKGAYNSTEKIVQWVFNRTSGLSDVDDLHTYDAVLNLNMKTGAFYPWTIDTTVGVDVNGIVVTRGTEEEFVNADVTNSALSNVTDSTGEQVTANVETSSIFANTFRYFTTVLDSGTNFNGTWATEADTNYEDWESAGTGVSYDSYLITGYRVHGEAIKKFQSNYIEVYSEFENNSSCFIQGIWDYATHTSTKRWSTAQQVYNVNASQNFAVVKRRLKIRGHGLTCQFKFYSEDNKPFNLIGWSTYETANATV
jgi:hypothetical protein